MSDEFFSARKYLTQQFNQKKACSMTLEEAKNKIIKEYGSQEKDLKIIEDEDGVFFLNTKNHESYTWDRKSGFILPTP